MKDNSFCRCPAIPFAQTQPMKGQNNMTTSTTPGDTAVHTWRDLTDKLTPLQIADLERQERLGADAHSPDNYRNWLIIEAHEYITENESDAELTAQIQSPANATWVGRWDNTDKAGRRCRSIQWATYDAGRTSVDIDGWQDETGAVDGPHLSVYGLEDNRPLTVADARRLAAALLAAADKIDGAL